MISGAHVIVYSKNAEADRAFFRDVLGFKSVDAGHGWLIFALPPAEAAVHLTRPSFCSTANERVYITAIGSEIEFGGTSGLWAAGAGGL
jgi:catechol 2,3-dioxygenase-like lactoylglutathione lyase family enzyme